MKHIFKSMIKTMLLSFFLAALATPVFASVSEIGFNCGGDAYTAVSGSEYLADREYTAVNGAGYVLTGDDIFGSTTEPINGTSDPVLYQTERHGNGPFSYQFRLPNDTDLPNGPYKVKLQFAEIYLPFDAPGMRVFDVLIEDTLILDDLDIYDEVGQLYAFDYEFIVLVDDGQLNVTFSASVDTYKLNAILVESLQPKPQSTGPVRVNGREIEVDFDDDDIYETYKIKGVGYQPIAIGEDLGWAYNIFADSDVYNRDLALLRAMGCNTIRTWGKVAESDADPDGVGPLTFTPAYDFLDACWNGGVDPIYVIMGFHPPNNYEYDDPFKRSQVTNEFRDYVATYKDHQAVLMWSIGNENNYWNTSDIRDWYSLVNEMAWAAYEVEGTTYHPVTHPNGDISKPFQELLGYGPIGDPLFKTDDGSMVYLDAWGANVYRGSSFGNLFSDYAIRSLKPLWLSEYGISGTNERSQAEGADLLWNEMVVNSNICSGGTIMAYSDEWWKAGNPAEHNRGGVEEFWGIVRVEDNGAEVDIMHPKPVYYTLQEKWTTGPKKNLALGKDAFASSDGGGGYPASNAVDGDLTTRWGSDVGSDPQDIYVDLGAVYQLSQVILRWDPAHASTYEIQVSDDAFAWATVYSTSTGDGDVDFIYFDTPRAKGRYVRMYGTVRGSPWGYSLWEFEVYGEYMPSNVALGKIVTASSVEGSYDPEYAVDGDFATRWSSVHSDPQWFSIDLGVPYDISHIVLRWETAYGISYRIEKSMGGQVWTDVYATTTGDGTEDYITFVSPFTARYIRLHGTERGSEWGYSLWEFEVIGKLASPDLVPHDYATIQAAINASDYVYVWDGEYGTYDPVKDAYDDIIIPQGRFDIVIKGDDTDKPTIKGNIVITEASAAIIDFEIVYDEGEYLSYTNGYYDNFKLLGDAGITAVDSEITVRGCSINPDPVKFTTDFGKGIQIWNLYGNNDIKPVLEGNTIENADAGIYLYSHASGGAIEGWIQDANTLDSNNHGIVMRMHSEKPLIDNNIISNSTEDGIHITYEDGSLLTDRINNITNNTFSGEAPDVFCDERGEEVPLP